MASAVSSTANAAPATAEAAVANAVGANGANGASASATAVTNGSGNATAVAVGADGAPGAPAQVVAVTIEVVRIFFAEGKSAVPTAAATDLSSIATYMKEHPEAKASISGFNDASGNADVNAEVSKNRAKAVRDTLSAAGVSTDRIELEKPQATTAGDTAAARRVEVTVHN
ncbi:OmpA family protein [Glaciimonas sp. GS1]|uniref:OmpA family protein n=2 Tax=Glaciimonas soli TaxID=2590999 RepID=A0A843YNP6_9BURK|nr:OmpA family protein [Glaciimonas soli]